MSFLSRFWLMPLFATTVVLSTTGCPPKGQTTNQADTQNQADPAAGNLAPADSNTAASASYSTSNTSAESAAPA